MPCGVEAVKGWPLKKVAWISLGVSFPAARAVTATETAAIPASTARMGDPPLDFVPGMIEQAREKPLRVFRRHLARHRPRSRYLVPGGAPGEFAPPGGGAPGAAGA